MSDASNPAGPPAKYPSPREHYFRQCLIRGAPEVELPRRVERAMKFIGDELRRILPEFEKDGQIQVVVWERTDDGRLDGCCREWVI